MNTSSPELAQQPTKTGGYFFGIAVVLLLIGLFLLRESEDEQFENSILALKYNEYSAASGVYQSTVSLYDFGGTSRDSVDRAKGEADAISDDIDKEKQKLSELAASRHFKMCLFLAGAAVFFIAGVIQSSRRQPFRHAQSPPVSSAPGPVALPTFDYDPFSIRPAPTLLPRPSASEKPATDLTIACPLCGESIAVSSVRLGENYCPYCFEKFIAE